MDPEEKRSFPPVEATSTPRYRPLDRYWPYVDLPEQPTPEELAALDPDLHAALFRTAVPGPFSVTVVFDPFEGPEYERAHAVARGSDEYRDVVQGTARRHRARFHTAHVAQLRDLWELVGRFDATDVLIDGRPVPYARELWLPLLWFLLPR
jgi:hypothetical protein